MENQVESKYLWVVGFKVCLEGMETVYRMWDLMELLLDIKSVTTNGGKVLFYSQCFLLSLKLKTGY